MNTENELNNTTKSEDKFCCECYFDLAKYTYENKDYCQDCLLNKLSEEGQIEVWAVNNYMIDGEYIGNDEDNDIEVIVDTIVQRLNIKKVED